MLLVSNVRSLKNEEIVLSKTKAQRQSLREAKNVANRNIAETAIMEPGDESEMEDESNLPKEGNNTNTKNEPIKVAHKKNGCPFCSKIMPKPALMKRHILTHTGEKPFICDTCGEAFNKKGNLARHNMIHTGERPFSCNICDKSFNQKMVLERHMKNIHSKTCIDTQFNE